MITLEEIQQIASKISLTLDNPKSVKLQVKQITLAQKQLRAIKKELNAAIRHVNQQATQSGADSVVSVGLDIFGKHKWAGRVRAETRRAIEREKKAAREPYLELKDTIDNVILEGDRLKLMAEEYLLCHQ
jgi:cell division protein FtsB